MPGLARKWMRDDEIVAGDVGKSPEIHGVVEAALASLKALVAASRYGEEIARSDWFWHRLPQYKVDGTSFAMGFHLNALAAVCTAGESQPPCSEPAVFEAVEPACRKHRRRAGRDDGPGTTESGAGKIDPAATVAKIG